MGLAQNDFPINEKNEEHFILFQNGDMDKNFSEIKDQSF